MYVITSGHANRLTVHHAFHHSLVLTRDSQYWLRNAKRDGLQLRCDCTGTLSSPLHTRRDATAALRPFRSEETEHEHVLTCIHGDSARIAGAYGAPGGSIAVRDGVISVNFDLLFADDEESSGGGGEWQGSEKDRGAALRSLLWLLLDQSGLHCSLPERQLGDPWDVLLREAKSIKVSRRGGTLTLADVLLTPVHAHPEWHGKRNYAKLCSAAATTKRVLVACQLPALGRDYDRRDIVDLSHPLDLRMNVSPALLARALGQAQFAGQRHAGNHPVLAFGSASAKMPKGRSAMARMNQLILMPIGPGLLPLPTQQHVDRFARSLETGASFSVAPNDDPLIAMRKSGGRCMQSASGSREARA